MGSLVNLVQSFVAIEWMNLPMLLRLLAEFLVAHIWLHDSAITAVDGQSTDPLVLSEYDEMELTRFQSKFELFIFEVKACSFDCELHEQLVLRIVLSEEEPKAAPI